VKSKVPTPYRPATSGWGSYRPSPGISELLEGLHEAQRRAVQLIGETLADGEPHLWKDVQRDIREAVAAGDVEVVWVALQRYPKSWLAWGGSKGQRTIQFTDHAMQRINQ
jgi:hypothetical protein